MENRTVHVVMNYKGFVIVKFDKETMHRIFSENDHFFEKEIGGFWAFEKAKAKIDSLLASQVPNQAPSESTEAKPTSEPQAPAQPIIDKAKAMSIEKVREKCQDIDALFVSRDHIKNTLRKMVLMRNADKEVGEVLCQFVNRKATNKADELVTFALHAQEILEKGIAITERSLEAVEFAITQRERSAQ